MCCRRRGGQGLARSSRPRLVRRCPACPSEAGPGGDWAPRGGGAGPAGIGRGAGGGAASVRSQGPGRAGARGGLGGGARPRQLPLASRATVAGARAAVRAAPFGWGGGDSRARGQAREGDCSSRGPLLAGALGPPVGVGAPRAGRCPGVSPVINSSLDGGQARGGPLSAPASPASDTAREPQGPAGRESTRTSLACPWFIFFPDPNAGAGMAQVTRCDISNPATCFLENWL